MVALSAVTVLVSTTPATANLGDGHGAGRIPAGAVRSTHGPEVEGWHGPAFGSPGARTRVDGVTAANSSDYPGVVAIQNFYWVWDQPGAGHYAIKTCTGTVIAPTKVLTAAHCVIGGLIDNMEIIAGRSVLSDTTSGYTTRPSNVWIHKGFNLTALYSDPHATPIDDVAVLTLRRPLPAPYVPVMLTAQGDQSAYAENTTSTVVGYGGVGGTVEDLATLHAVTVPLRSDATCQAAHQAFTSTVAYDTQRFACAGTPPTSSSVGDAIDTCDANPGAAMFVGSTQAGIRTWSPETGCPLSFGFYERLSFYNSAIMADAHRANMPVNLDFSGDGHSDLLFRVNRTGDLGQISGAGFLSSMAGVNNGGIAGILNYGNVDYHWEQYKKLFRVTNWNGDGFESVFAVKSTGELYQFETPGTGDLAGAVLIGTGFNAFADIAVTNSWFNDGRPNLMARTPAGVLKVYTSNGAGGWTNTHGTVIGSGWNMFNTVLTPGNWRGRGNSMIGRTASGDLRLYETNGTGGWLDGHGTLIGTGWNSLPTFISPGDWNGDNLVDLIGISSTGQFKLFPTNGQGGWLNGRGIVMTGGAWGNMPGLTVF